MVLKLKKREGKLLKGLIVILLVSVFIAFIYPLLEAWLTSTPAIALSFFVVGVSSLLVWFFVGGSHG